MFQTYILQSEFTKRYYIGSCNDINLRLKQHNTGRTRSTKNGIPWNIIYSENYQTRQEAYRRERQLKAYKGGEAFKKLIANV